MQIKSITVSFCRNMMYKRKYYSFYSRITLFLSLKKKLSLIVTKDVKLKDNYENILLPFLIVYFNLHAYIIYVYFYLFIHIIYAIRI